MDLKSPQTIIAGQTQDELRGLGWHPFGDLDYQHQRHRPPLIPSLRGSSFFPNSLRKKMEKEEGTRSVSSGDERGASPHLSCVRERDVPKWSMINQVVLESDCLILVHYALWVRTLIHLCIRFYLINSVCWVKNKKQNLAHTLHTSCPHLAHINTSRH